MEKVKAEGAIPKALVSQATKVGRRYVSLEREIRTLIDQVVSPVCGTCERVCCKASYCRRTLRNPWYRFLNEHFETGRPIPWNRIAPPPGLGSNGCVIRAGRYAYCYAYNCHAIIASLGSDLQRKIFQEISDLLKDVGLNFLGKRHLTDLEDWRQVTPQRLAALGKKIEEGIERFHKLRSLLYMDKPGN